MILNSFPYLLWLRLSTKRLRALSRPSGTSFNTLWLRSRVVRSSKWKSWAGMPELFTLLCRMLSVRNDDSSVNSPNSFSSPLWVKERCSCYNIITDYLPLPYKTDVVRPIQNSLNLQGHVHPLVSKNFSVYKVFQYFKRAEIWMYWTRSS